MDSKLLSTSRLAVLAPMTTAQAKARMDVQAFQHAMRKIWQDHLTWTRFVIVCVFEDIPDLLSWSRLVVAGAFEFDELPDLDPTVQRLLQSREDIGEAIKPFYGDEAGEQLTMLFKEHILIAAEILQAAKNPGAAVQNDAVQRWRTNADKIASFFNSVNPKYWPLAEMQARIREHLDLTLKEAIAYFGGDFDVSIAAYDKVHLHAVEIADVLSEGIILQFPDEFMAGNNN